MVSIWGHSDKSSMGGSSVHLFFLHHKPEEVCPNRVVTCLEQETAGVEQQRSLLLPQLRLMRIKAPSSVWSFQNPIFQFHMKVSDQQVLHEWMSVLNKPKQQFLQTCSFFWSDPPHPPINPLPPPPTPIQQKNTHFSQILFQQTEILPASNSDWSVCPAADEVCIWWTSLFCSRLINLSKRSWRSDQKSQVLVWFSRKDIQC